MKIKATITDLNGKVRWDGEIDADIDPDEGRTKPVTVSFTLPVDRDDEKIDQPVVRGADD